MDLLVWDVYKEIINSIPHIRRIKLARDRNFDAVDQQRVCGWMGQDNLKRKSEYV